jgi:pimeloyl-ACP methyl ester carboxylesterase
MMWLVLLPALLLAASGLTYVVYWYDTANGPGLERLRDLSGGRPGRWILQGLLTGALAQAILILTFPSAWIGRKRPLPPPDPDAREPIVFLVHGLYHNRSAWSFLRRRLARAGYRDVVLFEYSSWKGDFQRIAEELAATVRTIHGRAPRRPLLLVGHSLGGLLCRAAAQRLAELPLSGIITLGSPHQGSRLSVFALGRLGRALSHRGPLIREIEAGESPPPFPCIALASPVDNMVLPMDALAPPTDAWRVHWTEPVSHVAMLYHPRIHARVLQLIRKCQGVERES